MAMTDDKTDQAIGRLVRLSFKNPVVVGLIGVCLGGPVGNYIGAKKNDPRLDTLVAGQERVIASIGALQDSVSHNTTRITKLEDRDARVAYMAPRMKSLGRGWER